MTTLDTRSAFRRRSLAVVAPLLAVAGALAVVATFVRTAHAQDPPLQCTVTATPRPDNPAVYEIVYQADRASPSSRRRGGPSS